MPYYFDPYQYAYVYYPEGSKPPTPKNTGEEYIPGFAQEYVESFPNQPYSQMVGGSVAPSYGSSGSGSYASVHGTGNLDDPYVRTSSTNSEAASGGGGSGGTGDENAKRDAYEYLSRLFESYGLGSLAPKILEYVQQGYGADTIALMLQDTPEYKQRFAGNEARRKAGLSVLSPAEYLSLERSYRQILESNGMPKGFYDDISDFTTWIGSDVSPSEIQDRVQIAARAVSNTDNGFLESLREYGLGQGDLVASILDRERALPILQKTVREAEIGAEARRQGLRLSQARAAYFESIGVDGGQAASAYQMIGATLPTLENLGDIYGDPTYGQTALEDELLGRSGMQSERRRRLQQREVGTFSGESGLNRSSLGGPSRASY